MSAISQEPTATPGAAHSVDWGLGLRLFAAGAALALPAAFVAHPLLLLPLLAAQPLYMAAAFSIFGAAADGAWRDQLAGRAIAYFVLLVAYAALVAGLAGWPVVRLLATPSLTHTLMLSTALVFALLALGRSWPAFALLFLAHADADREERGSWILAAIARSMRRAWRATASGEHFFLHGLPVALALLSLTLGALALAGLGPVLAKEVRVFGACVYALLLAPFCHWVVVARSRVAMSAADTPPGEAAITEGELAADPDPVPSQEWPSDNASATGMALLEAVRGGQIDAALALIEAGADVHVAPSSGDRDQRSLLSLAAVVADLRLLRALIAAGADINRASGGLTPLLAATRDSHQGRPDAVTTLLTNGADPRARDTERNSALHYAALAADPIIAALLIDAGADLDALNRDAQSPLGLACSTGNWPLAKFLLEHGAATEPKQGPPVLLAAASPNDDDTTGIKLLLKHKARVDARGALGRSALMNAALHGHAAIAKVLLKAGADVNAHDEHGVTALMEAARAGANAVLAVLADHAPEANHRDFAGRSALIIASQSRQADAGTIKALLALKADAELASADGRRAVDIAAVAGRWALVAELDPNYPRPSTLGAVPSDAHADGGGRATLIADALNSGLLDAARELLAWPPALQQAELLEVYLELCSQTDTALFDCLLEHGLDPRGLTPDGQGLLHCVLQRERFSIVACGALLEAGAAPAGSGDLARLLSAIRAGRCIAVPGATESLALAILDAGGDPYGRNEQGHDALAEAMLATAWPRLVANLLERGVDPEGRDAHGRSHLFRLIGVGGEHCQTLLRLLLRYGADPDGCAEDGTTPLGQALLAQHSEILPWLQWSRWKLPSRRLWPSDLPAAAAVGDLAAVQKLIALGLPRDASDAQGCTALLRACGGGHPELVDWLLDQGADAGILAHTGASCLTAAVSAQRVMVVGRLLAHGVDIDQRVPGGYTPLMVAAARGLPEIVRLLLLHGADVHAVADGQVGALATAAQFAFLGHDAAPAAKIFNALLESGAKINSSNSAGQTALHLLLGARAEPGSKADGAALAELARLLLKAGADASAKDQRGATPLHAAAAHGLLEAVRVLLAAGANAQSRDTLGRSAQDLALIRGYADVAAELKAAPGGPPAGPDPARRAQR